MALTNAQRQAQWRQRQKENPEKYLKYKQKEKERYASKKSRGVIKSISEMTDREKRRKRRQWQKNWKSKKQKDKAILEAVRNTMSPPTSPENNQQQVAQGLGRRKVRKDRAKAYREIFRLRVALKKEERLKEKYKKRSQRLSLALKKPTRDDENKIIKNTDLRKAILFYHTIAENVRKRYRKSKSTRERKYISSLVCCNSLIRKYRLGQYARKSLGITHYQLKSSSDLHKDIWTRKTTMKSLRIKEVVREFLERDDNSRIKADKRATVTKDKEKKQVRLLCDDLKHLYAKYMSEGKRKISYSLFCKLRPFWVRTPTARDRETCLCKIHENLKFKLETAYTESMYASKNIEDLAKTITCSDKRDKKKCMYRECNFCKDKKIPKLTETDLGRQVKWKMWKSRKVEVTMKGTSGEQINKTSNRIVKDVEQGTLETLDNEANAELERICRHIYNIQNQYTEMKTLREKLLETEVLMHIDFSENYNCKYQAEVQSVHFGASQRQVTIHTGVLYSGNDVIPFATVSDSFNHGPGAIWAHLDPILRFIKTQKDVKVVHFLSDGPTTQYRNRKNLYLLCTRVFDMGFSKATWNFLESGHGKGAADGVGAVIKRAADKSVETRGKDIICADDLVNELKDLKVKLFLVKEDDISVVEKTLQSNIESVPKTMRLHQVSTLRFNYIIKVIINVINVSN